MTPQFIEQLKARILISIIVAKTISLKSRAPGEFIGLCPFHHEKTPSFTVSDNKAFYHCFGCGAHGDIITFIMETEAQTYQSAIQSLADTAGIQIPQKNLFKNYESCYIVIEAITKLYEQNLQLTIHKEGLSYLKKRGISSNIIKKYRIGFAPLNTNELLKSLTNNFSINQLKNTNILNYKNDKLYDPMRGRIIFPITDISNRIISKT